MSGAKQIEVARGKVVDVRLSVQHLSFSAHADAKGIMQLIRMCEPKNVMLVHGEKKKMSFLRDKIVDEYGCPCYFPANGQSVEIDVPVDVPVDVSVRLLKLQRKRAADEMIDEAKNRAERDGYGGFDSVGNEQDDPAAGAQEQPAGGAASVAEGKAKDGAAGDGASKRPRTVFDDDDDDDDDGDGDDKGAGHGGGGNVAAVAAAAEAASSTSQRERQLLDGVLVMERGKPIRMLEAKEAAASMGLRRHALSFAITLPLRRDPITTAPARKAEVLDEVHLLLSKWIGNGLRGGGRVERGPHGDAVIVRSVNVSVKAAGTLGIAWSYVDDDLGERVRSLLVNKLSCVQRPSDALGQEGGSGGSGSGDGGAGNSAVGSAAAADLVSKAAAAATAARTARARRASTGTWPRWR